MPIRSTSVTAILALLISGAAYAQQPEQSGQAGRGGLVFMYPTAVGLIYHVSDALALRPDFSFSRTTSEYSNPGIATTSTSTTVAFGISVPLYFHSWDTVRIYAAPRFGYARLTSDYTMALYTGATYSGSGSLGVQYVFTRRLGVFAEGGVNYDHKRLVIDGTTISKVWSLRTVLGATVYF